MAITSGFFDSVSGDRTYNAEQMSSYFDGLVSDGVFENVGDRLLVSPAPSGLAVTVASGRALIQCHWFKNDSVEVVNLDPADIAMNRIDAICLRLDLTARQISLTVKKGTAVAGNPTIPEITHEGSVYELYLAAVLVNRGATTPSAVTDLRASSYCGWVTGLIHQVDTSDLFAQWQAAYEAQFAAFASFIALKEAAFNVWFENLTEELTVQTGIVKLQHRSHVSGGSNSAPVGVEGFNPREDILLVYVNGIFYAEGLDYEIVNVPLINPPYIVRLKGGKTFSQASDVDCVVLRNEIGNTVLADVASVSAIAVPSGSVDTATDFDSMEG